MRLAVASPVEPRPCGLFPACTSTEESIHYGVAAVERVSASRPDPLIPLQWCVLSSWDIRWEMWPGADDGRSEFVEGWERYVLFTRSFLLVLVFQHASFRKQRLT